MNFKPLKILFLTLKTFSASGGIEKVCRLAGKAMYEYSKESQEDFTMYSMYDEKEIKTEPYLPSAVFKGFAGGRLWFIIKSLQQGIKSRVVVLSHINFITDRLSHKIIFTENKNHFNSTRY